MGGDGGDGRGGGIQERLRKGDHIIRKTSRPAVILNIQKTNKQNTDRKSSGLISRYI